MWLRISNKGEVEAGAFQLMGASAKESDNAIGSFGSGLKYSIAALLRLKVPFKVFSGSTEVKITTVSKTFRNKTFDVICFNGEESSLTTEMGVGISKDWDSEFPIFREIYSNALDEGEAELQVVHDTVGIEGKTTFYIDYSSQFAEFFNNFDEYFTQKLTPLEHDGDVAALRKGRDKNIRLFRKGILAYSTSKDEANKSLFNYDLDEMEINESRVASDLYSVKTKIGNFWANVHDLGIYKEYVEGMRNANTGIYEHSCEHYSWRTPKLSSDIVTWLKSKRFVAVEHIMVLEDVDIQEWYAMPLWWIKSIMMQIKDLTVLGITSSGVFMDLKTPSTDLFDKVMEVKDMLALTSYKDKIDFSEIKYAKFESKDVKGIAVDGVITLSVSLENSTVDEIAKIIIHEYWHLASGEEDSTRAFETFMLNEFYTELTRKIKVSYM